MKFIGKLLISLLIIIVIVAIIFVVLINLTPRQLHINEIKIADTSLEELGLSDVKLIDIYKSFKNLGKTNESDVVKNGYNEEEEKTNADKATEGSSLEGKDNYSSILTDKVTYPKALLVEYKDTTLACMLDNAIKNAAPGSSDAAKALKDANITIKEMTVAKNTEEATIRLVCLVDLSQFKDQIEGNLGAAKSFIKVPEKVYLVSDLKIAEITDAGKMVLASKDVCINGNNDDPVSKAIMNVMCDVAGFSSVDDINAKLGDALADVIGNLGKIGTASTTNGNEVVDGTILIGMNGISDHKVQVITYTE